MATAHRLAPGTSASATTDAPRLHPEGKRKTSGVRHRHDRGPRSPTCGQNRSRTRLGSAFEAASYGFRPGRSVHDAIAACFNRLNGRSTARWVLDADIRSAFDRISHVYIDQRLGNFPARRQIQAWLKAGYLEHGHFFRTTEGTPQGAICSPLVANVALDGLANLLASRFPYPVRRTRPYLGYIRYADDLIVTSPDKGRLEAAVPVIQEWLAERGLELNADKTRIVP